MLCIINIFINKQIDVFEHTAICFPSRAVKLSPFLNICTEINT